jgi:SAM-dependent methyltransferase
MLRFVGRPCGSLAADASRARLLCCGARAFGSTAGSQADASRLEGANAARLNAVGAPAPSGTWFRGFVAFTLVEPADRAQIAFYLERAREAGGGVLELGCGTGVTAVALALAGVEVVAFEPSAELVAQAIERRRAHGLAPDRCRIERADLRAVRLPERFGLACAPSDALLSLSSLDDLISVFATAAAHLAPEGSFAFDIRVHAGRPSDEARPTRSPIEQHLAQRRRPHLSARGGPGRPRTVHRLHLLSLSEEEIETAVAETGLEMLERWGGFEGAEYGPEADRMVGICARASG